MRAKMSIRSALLIRLLKRTNLRRLCALWTLVRLVVGSSETKFSNLSKFSYRLPEIHLADFLLQQSVFPVFHRRNWPAKKQKFVYLPDWYHVGLSCQF